MMEDSMDELIKNDSRIDWSGDGPLPPAFEQLMRFVVGILPHIGREQLSL